MNMAKDHQGNVQELMKKMKDVQGMRVDPKMLESIKGDLFNLQGGGNEAPEVEKKKYFKILNAKLILRIVSCLILIIHLRIQCVRRWEFDHLRTSLF